MYFQIVMLEQVMKKNQNKKKSLKKLVKPMESFQTLRNEGDTMLVTI